VKLIKRVTITFPMEVYEYLRKRAYEEHRSMTGIVVEILKREMKKK